MRQLDGSLVSAGALGASMKELASAGQRAPVLSSDVFDTTSGVEEAVTQLAGPLASARALGVAIGFAVVIAAGVFLVERRRTEFRLLASEGERWPKMAARVAGQLSAVAVVGGGIGVFLAVAGPRWFGPAVSHDFGRLPWMYLALTIVVALLLASVSAGVMGARTLASPSRQTRRAVSRVLVMTLVVSTVVAWVQVGRTTAARGASIDLVVVALPVLVVAFVVLVVVEALGWAVRLLGRRGERLPVELFLAARRLASGSLAVRLVAGSLGIGIGLLVFALAITATLDRTLDVRLATSVGGASSLTLLDDLPPTYQAPAPTTVIAESDTRLMPGAVQGRVIAIDPATYADAVTWSDQFGLGVDEVLAALAEPSDESIPVIAIEGEPVPSEGVFGLTRSYPYRVVATVRGFPTAGNRKVSLLTSAEAIEAYAAEVGNEGARPPLEAFRDKAVSQANAAALTESLDDAGVRYRDVVSQLELRQEPSIVATRSAFGYLGAIGITAAAAACVALGLFLSARRRSRALTGVITRSMGLSAPRAATISAFELGSMLLVSVGAGFVAAPLVVSRLAPRFDPAPGRPPTVNVLVDWVPLVAGALVGVFVVAGLVWLSEWKESRRPAGAVVRDAD
jgi:putative ABC transport system permease protein